MSLLDSVTDIKGETRAAAEKEMIRRDLEKSGFTPDNFWSTEQGGIDAIVDDIFNRQRIADAEDRERKAYLREQMQQSMRYQSRNAWRNCRK